MKLWYKGYDLAPLVERYEAGRNVALDAELARSDIWGSLAHVAELCAIGLLTDAEADALHWTLCQLLAKAEAGTLIADTCQEDIHTLVEQTLIASLGDTGKKVHAGRSRNDQILTDLRLYAKECMFQTIDNLLDAAEALLSLARKYEWTPLPGYTHMQRGMLSSVGLWASSFVEALLDDCVSLAAAYRLTDRSPLGSGAAYGSALPLDREYSARILGFAKPQHNVLSAANSRGKIEATVVQALSLIMVDLSKLAEDVLLYTTSEYGFFQVPQELCSGSSMMPQKRNLGALELVRARAHTVIAAESQMLALLAGLPSGYNMDYQETKAPFIESLHITRESLAITGLFAGQITVDEDRVRVACSEELFAADRALALTLSGVPFREAYRRSAFARPDGETTEVDLEARLRERTATGMPGNLDLEALASLIAAERSGWDAQRTTFTQAIADLIGARPQPGSSTRPGTSTSQVPRQPAEDIVLGI